jgi:hypothetical protein
MKVKMLIPVSGVVESIYQDVQPGDVIDIPLDSRAKLWISQKLAVAVDPNTACTARPKDTSPAHY